MLDTNICIYIRQRRPPQVLKHLEKLESGDVVLSAITLGELRRWVERSAQRERAEEQIERLISVIPVQPVPVEAAIHYGEIRTALEAAGTIIGGNDLWIAAQARSQGLTLVTNNEREFKRVRGLKIENWAK